MLIKSVTKSGDAVPFSPEEALTHAVAIAVSKQQSSDFIYWVVASTPMQVSSFSHTNSVGGGYDAYSAGVVKIGKTRIADDKFFIEKPYKFKIHFQSSKDELGAPHLNVVDFNYTLVEMNPSKAVGEKDLSAPDWQPFTQKAKGGAVSKKTAE